MPPAPPEEEPLEVELELLAAPPMPWVVAPWVALDDPHAMSHAEAMAPSAMSGESGDGA